jgi:membrane protein DedA with SNARE-associated domain
MESLFHVDLHHMIAAHGYWVVALMIGLEGIGLPLPGEATLIAAAMYAGKTGNLMIEGVVAAATIGAVLGFNIGYLLGREVGFPLMLRYGPRLGISERKLKLGEYLFLRHGGKVVFFGRFVALLRILAAFLAGANRMPWRWFLVCNATGGVVWALIYGGGAFILGAQIHRVTNEVAIVGTVLGIIGLFLLWRLFRRHQDRLEEEAEAALPGPLAARRF